MQGSTHRALGAGAALGIATVTGATLPEALVMLISGSIVGTLPDIDLNLPIEHRGPTHSAIVMLSLVAFGVMTNAYALALAAAYSSHVIADMLTKRGVMLAYPFSVKWWYLSPRPLRLVTGGAVERIVIYYAVLLSVLIMIYGVILA